LVYGCAFFTHGLPCARLVTTPLVILTCGFTATVYWLPFAVCRVSCIYTHPTYCGLHLLRCATTRLPFTCCGSGSYGHTHTHTPSTRFALFWLTHTVTCLTRTFHTGCGSGYTLYTPTMRFRSPHASLPHGYGCCLCCGLVASYTVNTPHYAFWFTFSSRTVGSIHTAAACWFPAVYPHHRTVGYAGLHIYAVTPRLGCAVYVAFTTRLRLHCTFYLGCLYTPFHTHTYILPGWLFGWVTDAVPRFTVTRLVTFPLRLPPLQLRLVHTRLRLYHTRTVHTRIYHHTHAFTLVTYCWFTGSATYTYVCTTLVGLHILRCTRTTRFAFGSHTGYTFPLHTTPHGHLHTLRGPPHTWIAPLRARLVPGLPLVAFLHTVTGLHDAHQLLVPHILHVRLGYPLPRDSHYYVHGFTYGYATVGYVVVLTSRSCYTVYAHVCWLHVVGWLLHTHGLPRITPR